MARGNVFKPKFFIDNINWLADRGLVKDDEIAIDTGTGSIAIATGTKFDLMDQNPFRSMTFDTSSDTDGYVGITIDYTVNSIATDFLAIMNQNGSTANVKCRVMTDDTSAITAPEGNATSTVLTPTAVLNATVDASAVTTLNEALDNSEIDVDVTDASAIADYEMILIDSEAMLVTSVAGNTLTVVRGAGGTTAATHDNTTEVYYYRSFSLDAVGDVLVTLVESDDRYSYICFFGNNDVMTATDLQIGQIHYGQTYTCPVSADLSVVGPAPNYDTTTIRQSESGKRHAHAGSLRANDDNAGANYIPFKYGTGLRQMSGRREYSLSFSFISDSELHPNDYSGISDTNDEFYGVLVRKTDWNFRPVIWTPDSTSTTEGDYMWCRLTGSAAPTQVAWRVQSVSFGVSEEF